MKPKFNQRASTGHVLRLVSDLTNPPNDSESMETIEQSPEILVAKIGDRLETRLKTQPRTLRIEIENQIQCDYANSILTDYPGRWSLILANAEVKCGNADPQKSSDGCMPSLPPPYSHSYE